MKVDFEGQRFCILPVKLLKEDVGVARRFLESSNGHIVDEFDETVDVVLTKLTSLPRISKSIPGIADKAKIVNIEWLWECQRKGKLLPVSKEHIVSLPSSQKADTMAKLFGKKEPKTSSPSSIFTVTPKRKQSTDSDSKSSTPPHSASNTPLSKRLKEPNSPGIDPSFNNSEYACLRPTPLSCVNDDIVGQFKKISKARALVGEERSVLSYDKAIAAIRGYPRKITSGSEAEMINGVGPKMARMVRDFLHTGSIGEVQQLEKDPMLPVLAKFESIYSVGPATAKQWYEQGNRSIEDLFANGCLNPKQQVWALHFDELIEDMDRAEGMQLFDAIQKVIVSLESDAIVTCTGGFRRGKSHSRDLDMLVSLKGGQFDVPYLLRRSIEMLKQENLLMHILLQATRKRPYQERSKSQSFMDDLDKVFGLYKSPASGKLRQVDIVMVPADCYGAALLGWTGSKQFERSLRKYAKDMRNLHLTNTGIWDNDTNEKLSAPTEESIFKLLAIPYLPPEKRNC